MNNMGLQRRSDFDAFKELKEKKKELVILNGEIAKSLNGSSPFNRGMAKIFNFVPFLKKFSDKYTDPISMLEYRLKDFINGVQEALLNLQSVAKKKYAEIEQMRIDLDRAITEDWSAERLRYYIIEQSGLKLYDGVEELLNFEESVISPELVEIKKRKLISLLRNNVIASEELTKLVVQTVFSAVSIFEEAVGQYYAFTSIAAPIKAIQNAAGNLVDATDMAQKTPEYINLIVKSATEAIDIATKAAEDLSKNHSVVGKDVIDEFVRAREKLAQSSNRLVEAPKETRFLPSPLK